MQYIPPPNRQAYFEQVWQWVRQVPHAHVVTYGQLTRWIPIPEGIDAEQYKASSARWVGAAMAACPDDVPWHRVINAQGKVSQRPEAKKQQQLLQQEGVVFVKDRLDLSTYQWHGSDHQTAPQQGSLF